MNMTHRVLSLVACALVIASCASLSSREPSAVGPAFVTPSAQELFLTGRFLVKKNPLKFLDEDHYGEELDLSERRPTKDLSGTIFDKKYARPGYRLMANFYHQGEFFVALVPKKTVKNVYFILSYFPPKVLGHYIAAHSLLRFELEKPIELVAKMPTLAEWDKIVRSTPEDGFKLLPEPLVGEEFLVRNMAISAEAQWAKTDKYKKYSLKRGKLGAFIQIVRFESMQTRFDGFYASGNPATQVKFDLKNAESGDKILAEALRSSEADALTKIYDTFWYNCTTLAFDVIERAEGVKDERLGFIRSFMEKRIPVIAPGKIAQYGGLEATPMELDPSLLDESEEAYQDKIAMPRRELCPEEFSEENCEHVKSAVAALKRAGRI